MSEPGRRANKLIDHHFVSSSFSLPLSLFLIVVAAGHRESADPPAQLRCDCYKKYKKTYSRAAHQVINFKLVCISFEHDSNEHSRRESDRVPTGPITNATNIATYSDCKKETTKTNVYAGIMQCRIRSSLCRIGKQHRELVRHTGCSVIRAQLAFESNSERVVRFG